jgi:hypothetical protein
MLGSLYSVYNLECVLLQQTAQPINRIKQGNHHDAEQTSGKCSASPVNSAANRSSEEVVQSSRRQPSGHVATECVVWRAAHIFDDPDEMVASAISFFLRF